MNLNYKKALHSDIGAILAMMEVFYTMYNYPFDKEQTTKNLVEFIYDKRLGSLWVIREQEQTVGYVILAFGYSFSYGGKDAMLDELFIKEEYRGMGVGTRTIEFILEQAVQMGVKTVHLEVEKHNVAGRALYKKQGFESDDTIFMSKKIQGKGQEGVFKLV